MLIESQKHVLDKFYKGMMAKKVKKPIVKEEKPEDSEVKGTTIKQDKLFYT